MDFVLFEKRAAQKYLLTLQPQWNDPLPDLCFDFYF